LYTGVQTVPNWAISSHIRLEILKAFRDPLGVQIPLGTAASVNFDTTKPLHSDRGCGVETQAILKAARRLDPHVVDAVAEFIKDPDAK
jgi:hypothetical protein